MEPTSPGKAGLPPPEQCSPVAATAKLMGGKYKPLILWKLLDGPCRFSVLQKSAPCATPKMLTRHLRELENDGLINRTVHPVVPPNVEYALTNSGLSLRPVLEAMYAWGFQYLGQDRLAQRKETSPSASGESPIP